MTAKAAARLGGVYHAASQGLLQTGGRGTWRARGEVKTFQCSVVAQASFVECAIPLENVGSDVAI